MTTPATPVSTVMPEPELLLDSPARRVWRKFKRNRVGTAAAWVVAAFFAIAIISFITNAAGWYWPCNPNATDLAHQLQPPSSTHWMGTDNLGRDVFARILIGSYISLTVGFIAVAVSLAVGVLVGAVSGYCGGWVDNLLMRAVDAIMCFPTFFLILTAVALLGPNILNIIVIIGLVSWTGTARLVRAEFLTLRETEYVRAARALAVRAPAIIFRHILPNAAAPIIVTAMVSIPDAILTEASLSYLGFGVQPPQATWGNIITDGKTYLLDAWWLSIFPGLALFIVSLAFYLLGDALRQAAETRDARKS